MNLFVIIVQHGHINTVSSHVYEITKATPSNHRPGETSTDPRTDKFRQIYKVNATGTEASYNNMECYASVRPGVLI